MMKLYPILIVVLAASSVHAQSSFKAGWNTYPTASITHEYTYTFALADSIRPNLMDTASVLTSPDSLVTVTQCAAIRGDKAVYKTVHYFNAKKQILKTEEFKDGNQTSFCEWKYDDKNRKCYQLQENKLTGNIYKKTYDYTTDKKSGDIVISENAYYNGRVEFYTKSYYDKNHVKYKEVRLNDNNKDVVHIETFAYGENGKVKERTVFFPEWKVTKKFPEKEGMMPLKCSHTLPPGITDRPALHTSADYVRRLAMKHRNLLTDSACPDFELKVNAGNNCEVIFTPARTAKNVKAVFRYKEKPGK